MGEKFHALSPEERAKYDEMEKKDKRRYRKEMESYVPPDGDGDGDTTRTVSKGKKKKDPNAPKAALSSYLLFSNSIRGEIKENDPNISFGETAKIISTRFKALSAEEKSKWTKLAAKDKERYKKEMAAYKAKRAGEE